MSIAIAPTPTQDPVPAPSLNDLKLRLARLVRHHRSQSEIDAARQVFVAAKLTEYISATVAKAPPLSEPQIAALSALLRGAPPE